MNKIKSANKNLVQIGKEIDALGKNIEELVKHDLNTEKEQKYINVVLNNIDLCGKILTAHKETLLQNIYKKKMKIGQEVDR